MLSVWVRAELVFAVIVFVCFSLTIEAPSFHKREWGCLSRVWLSQQGIRNAKHSADAGLTPQRGKGFSQTFSVNSLHCVGTSPMCSPMHRHLCACQKSQALAAIPLFGPMKVLHALVGICGAALCSCCSLTQVR